MSLSPFTDKEVLTELGSRIKRLRLQKNLQQVDLAKRAGVSSNTVSNAERGMAIGLHSFIAIVRALGRIDDLMRLLDTPDISPLEIAKLKSKRRKRVR